MLSNTNFWRAMAGITLTAIVACNVEYQDTRLAGGGGGTPKKESNASQSKVGCLHSMSGPWLTDGCDEHQQTQTVSENNAGSTDQTAAANPTATPKPAPTTAPGTVNLYEKTTVVTQVNATTGVWVLQNPADMNFTIPNDVSAAKAFTWKIVNNSGVTIQLHSDNTAGRPAHGNAIANGATATIMLTGPFSSTNQIYEHLSRNQKNLQALMPFNVTKAP